MQEDWFEFAAVPIFIQDFVACYPIISRHCALLMALLHIIRVVFLPFPAFFKKKNLPGTSLIRDMP